jgi:hypothetical protein
VDKYIEVEQQNKDDFEEMLVQFFEKTEEQEADGEVQQTTESAAGVSDDSEAESTTNVGEEAWRSHDEPSSSNEEASTSHQTQPEYETPGLFGSANLSGLGFLPEEFRDFLLKKLAQIIVRPYDMQEKQRIYRSARFKKAMREIHSTALSDVQLERFPRTDVQVQTWRNCYEPLRKVLCLATDEKKLTKEVTTFGTCLNFVHMPMAHLFCSHN